MADESNLHCPQCGGRYKMRPEYVGRKVLCKKCQVPLQSPHAPAQRESAAVPPNPALAAAVRQALNEYAESVPEHGLEELGSEIKNLRAQSGQIYKVRIAAVVEERVAEREWQTPEGKAVMKEETIASPAPGLADPGAEVPECTTCMRAGHVPCGACRGARQTPCLNCEGKGKLTCGVCQGSGKVVRPHRHSGGMTLGTCPTCRGEKVVACHVCLGRSTQICKACTGKGRAVCPTCHGKSRKKAAAIAPPLPPVTLDPWRFDRAATTGFAALTEEWTVEAKDATCPVCKGEERTICAECLGAGTATCRNCQGTFRRPCSICHGRGKGCAACGGCGIRLCGVCNGKGVSPCRKCAGAKAKKCSACVGKGELRLALIVRRAVTPSATVRFVGDLPLKEEAFLGWELEGFASLQRLAGEGAAIADRDSKVPRLVQETLQAVAGNEWPAPGGSRRVLRHAVEVSRAEAVYAKYTYEGEEYECWLLGPERTLHAPTNALTRGLDAKLAEVCSLAEAGERKQAGKLLKSCRAMAEADPFCARQLEQAADRLPDDLNEKGGWFSGS